MKNKAYNLIMFRIMIPVIITNHNEDGIHPMHALLQASHHPKFKTYILCMHTINIHVSLFSLKEKEKKCQIRVSNCQIVKIILFG